MTERNMNENKNNYAPNFLTEEEVNQLVKKLSNPRLKPYPSTYNWKRILADKVDNADELAERIETEKKVAYQVGWEAGKKAAQIL